MIANTYRQRRTCPLAVLGIWLSVTFGSSGYTLEEAVQLALENNPDLQLAELVTARAASEMAWAGRWKNPAVEIELVNDQFGEDEGESSFQIAIRQTFPLTSRLRKEKELKSSELLLASAEIDEFRRTLAFRVEKAVIQLTKTRLGIKQHQALTDMNQNMVKFLQMQLERGESSDLAVNQTILTGQQLEQQSQATQADERKQAFALRALLGMDGAAPLDITHTLTLPDGPREISESKEELLSRRPDYVLALAKLQAAELLTEFERARRWEDLSVRLSGEWEEATDEPAGLEENTLVGLSVSLPLPLWQRNQGAIERAGLEQDAARTAIRALEFRIHNELDEALQAHRDAYRLAQGASGEFIQLAEQNFESLRSAYEQGLTGLLQVQQAQQQLIELKAQELEAIAGYYLAEARLRYVTGESLHNFTTSKNSRASTSSAP